MKTSINILNIVLFLALSFSYTNFSFSQNEKAIASCCQGKEGKCTGSAYCKVCTNCSRCGYCNSGGSCGVCSRGYTRAKKKSNSNNYNTNKVRSSSSLGTTYSYSKTNIYYLPDDVYSKHYLKKLVVDTETLNLRSGPGTSYSVIEKLDKGQELILLAMTGNWIKVKVKKSQTTGFIYNKYVVLVD